MRQVILASHEQMGINQPSILQKLYLKSNCAGPVWKVAAQQSLQFIDIP
jgi:hypothetical protein